MKIMVFNFSANVGKSSLAKHLFFRKLANAKYITVETICFDGSDDRAIRLPNQDYGHLLDMLSTCENAVIDVGSSNAERFIKNMATRRGCYDEIDYIIVPCVPTRKQQHDTISSIDALTAIGVDPHSIRVICNYVEYKENVKDHFTDLFAYLDRRGDIGYSPEYFVPKLHFYDMAMQYRYVDIPALSQDDEDYKAQLRDAQSIGDEAEQRRLLDMISLRRLSKTAYHDLDRVYDYLSLTPHS